MEKSGKIFKSLFWKTLEQYFSQGIQFVTAMLLARLMSPEEFGTISLITIFITIANTLIQQGFSVALIQGKDIEEEDFSTSMWVSVLIAILCYTVLFLGAPLISFFYRKNLTMLLRIMGIILFPGAIVSIQTAYTARKMLFKRLCISTVFSVTVSGICAVFLAIRNFGVWAICFQQLIFYFSLMPALFFMISWRPEFKFNINRLRKIFSFGSGIMISGLIDTVWQNIYGLIIGKSYSATDLGFYNRGDQFPKLFAVNLSQAMQSVLLPVFSRSQEDRENLRDLARRSVRISAFFIFPMMAGLAGVSEPLIRLLLTDKWIGSSNYLRILALCYAFYPIHIINLEIIKSLGKSGIFLRMEIIKKILGIMILLLSLPFGIKIMLLLKALDEMLCTVINAWPNRKFLDYGPLRQYIDLIPSVLISLLMGFSVYFLGLKGINIIFQIISGIIIYLIISLIFNRDVIKDIFKAMPFKLKIL